jgi:8-oxo-dGTP pyrophosphatase MutT (NUDIX family)
MSRRDDAPAGRSWPPVIADNPLLTRLAESLRRRARRHARLEGFRPAAVLIPLVPRPEGIGLTFMQRTEDGGTHSGQIAFPGGARETEDRTLVDTALREAQEEVNIRPETVTPLGQMDDSASISQYIVTPVVGVVHPPPAYAPDPREVQEIFEVPLSFLLDPQNEHHVSETVFLGQTWDLYEYRYEGRVIWGLTGRIVHELLDLLRPLQHDLDPGR